MPNSSFSTALFVLLALAASSRAQFPPAPSPPPLDPGATDPTSTSATATTGDATTSAAEVATADTAATDAPEAPSATTSPPADQDVLRVRGLRRGYRFEATTSAALAKLEAAPPEKVTEAPPAAGRETNEEKAAAWKFGRASSTAKSSSQQQQQPWQPPNPWKGGPAAEKTSSEEEATREDEGAYVVWSVGNGAPPVGWNLGANGQQSWTNGGASPPAVNAEPQSGWVEEDSEDQSESQEGWTDNNQGGPWNPPANQNTAPPPGGWAPVGRALGKNAPTSSTGNGWDAQQSSNAWTAPPQANNGWTPPQSNNGWTPNQSNNGWTPPQASNGWTPPQSNNGWTPPQQSGGASQDGPEGGDDGGGASQAWNTQGGGVWNAVQQNGQGGGWNPGMLSWKMYDEDTDTMENLDESSGWKVVGDGGSDGWRLVNEKGNVEWKIENVNGEWKVTSAEDTTTKGGNATASSGKTPRKSDDAKESNATTANATKVGQLGGWDDNQQGRYVVWKFSEDGKGEAKVYGGGGAEPEVWTVGDNQEWWKGGAQQTAAGGWKTEGGGVGQAGGGWKQSKPPAPTSGGPWTQQPAGNAWQGESPQSGWQDGETEDEGGWQNGPPAAAGQGGWQNGPAAPQKANGWQNAPTAPQAGWQNGQTAPQKGKAWQKGSTAPQTGGGWQNRPAAPQKGKAWQKGPSAAQGGGGWQNGPTAPQKGNGWQNGPAPPQTENGWQRPSKSSNGWKNAAGPPPNWQQGNGGWQNNPPQAGNTGWQQGQPPAANGWQSGGRVKGSRKGGKASSKGAGPTPPWNGGGGGNQWPDAQPPPAQSDQPTAPQGGWQAKGDQAINGWSGGNQAVPYIIVIKKPKGSTGSNPWAGSNKKTKGSQKRNNRRSQGYKMKGGGGSSGWQWNPAGGSEGWRWNDGWMGSGGGFGGWTEDKGAMYSKWMPTAKGNAPGSAPSKGSRKSASSKTVFVFGAKKGPQRAGAPPPAEEVKARSGGKRGKQVIIIDYTGGKKKTLKGDDGTKQDIESIIKALKTAKPTGVKGSAVWSGAQKKQSWQR